MAKTQLISITVLILRVLVLDAATEEERARLEIQGEFHLGEFVNKFCRGSLLMQVSNDSSLLRACCLGTCSSVTCTLEHRRLNRLLEM